MSRASKLRAIGRWLAQLALGALLFALGGSWSSRASPPPIEEPVFGTVQSPIPAVRYTMEARLDEKTHRVHGTSHVRWRNTSQVTQRSLFLHLYLNAFASKQTVFMRQPMSGFRGGGFPSTPGGIDIERIFAPGTGLDLWPMAEQHTPGDPDDATDIELRLPVPVAPGGELELDIDWVSRLPSITHRTGFAGSFHMVGQWFPKLARLEPDGTWAHFPFYRLSEFYADFGDYDVTLDVPSSFVVGATGTAVEELDDGERKRVRFVAERVHDFAFTAWDGFAEQTSETASGIQLRCLYPAGLDEVATVELDEVKAALPVLAAAYGDYPYPSLTVVHPPRFAEGANGMEYPTLITTGGDALLGRLGARNLAIVTVHELAHQWFYGLLASNEFRRPFLDEGLTTFASSHALEQRYPTGSAFDGFGWKTSLWALSRYLAAEAWDADKVARGADDFSDGFDYGRLVYWKTATLLETLRRTDGDERFFAALGAYTKHQRFAHPTTDDLLAAVRDEMGPVAADNLQVGLLEPSWVDYRALDLDDGGDVLALRQGNLAFDVEVVIEATDGSVRRFSWPATERTLRLAMVDMPRDDIASLSIDPDVRVLLDRDLRNNVSRRGSRLIAPRVLAEGGLVVQLLNLVLAP